MCLYCIGKVSNCSIKSCGRSWSAHGGTIYAYTKPLLGKNCISSHSCHFVKNYFFWTRLLHAYVQCVFIVSAKYQIAPLKAVVGVDRHMEIYAYTKPLLGKNCISSHSCHFVKIIFLWTKLLHAYVQCVYIVLAKYNFVPSKAVVGVDCPMKAPSMHIQNKALLGKNCLSSDSCHFVKNYFFWTTPLCMFNVSTLYWQSIKFVHQKLWWELIDPWRHHCCIYKHLTREKLSKFSLLSFCQKLLFLNQTPSCICSMCLYCIGKVSNCCIKSCGGSWSAHVWPIIA